MAGEPSYGGLAAAAQAVERLLSPLLVGLAVLATAAGVAIVALVGVSVAMRYLANAPLYYTEELVGLLMTAAFFLALPLVTLRAEHVRVTILVANLPPAMRRAAGLLAGLFGVVFCLWFFALCLPWLEFAFSRNLKSEAARLLLYPWMALLPLSLMLSALAFAVRALAGRRNGVGT